MRGFGMLLVWSAVTACGSAGTQGGTGRRAPLTAKDIAARSTPAIVRIEAGEATGTGFIVDARGLVATNLHVIAGSDDVKIKLHDGAVYPALAVTSVDQGRDLALVRIAPPRPLPVLQLGDSSRMVAGDPVVAIGNQLGVFTFTVTDGLVSQVREECSASQVERHRKSEARFAELTGKLKALQQCLRGAAGRSCEPYALSPAEQQEFLDLRCTQELTVLQISVPISQGSSGGPLFNLAGEVVGVTTAIITAGQNLNLAIPSNYLRPMLASPAQLSMREFAAATKEALERESGGGGGDGPRIQRLIPDHQLSIFAGCTPEQISGMVLAIEQAIKVGAPLYNAGEIEACFRIYEGTAVKFERDSGCAGIRAAFTDGLTRARTLDTYKEKAWAMRDTFDGLLKVAEKWVKASGKPLPMVSPVP